MPQQMEKHKTRAKHKETGVVLCIALTLFVFAACWLEMPQKCPVSEILERPFPDPRVSVNPHHTALFIFQVQGKYVSRRSCTWKQFFLNMMLLNAHLVKFEVPAGSKAAWRPGFPTAASTLMNGKKWNEMERMVEVFWETKRVPGNRKLQLTATFFFLVFHIEMFKLLHL